MMSMQEELNKDLLLYVFTNKNFPNYKELKKIICNGNTSKEKSFLRSYKLLEDTNILKNGKLNPELSDIYEITEKVEQKNNANAFVSILINVLPEYRKAKIKFDSYLIKNRITREKYYSDNRYNLDVNYFKELPENKEIYNFELVIKDLFDRFIYAKILEKQQKVPNTNGNYDLKNDLPKSRQTTTELAFRDILDYILSYEPSTIPEKKILGVVDMYYYGNEDHKTRDKGTSSITKTTTEQKEMAAKNAIKNSVITVLKELKIITVENVYPKSRYGSTDNREFQLIKFQSSSWKMNAKTKHDAISSLIGGISNMTNVSDENKKLANFIIDFIG